MHPSGFITLTSDFGSDSPYIAAMKGVILTMCPTARIFDLCHNIEPQNVTAGALTLEDVAALYPPGTVHIAVIDPGVGTNRKILLAQIGDYFYIAPNNGLLDRVIRQAEKTKTSMAFYSLDRSEYWRESISNTFHGRDVMAPVAAHLLSGRIPSDLGVKLPIESVVRLNISEPKITSTTATGIIESIDSFGNLISNIRLSDIKGRPLDDSVTISLSGSIISQGVYRTYADKPVGSVIAIIDSIQRVEIAVVNGSAAKTLNASVGDEVVLTWRQ